MENVTELFYQYRDDVYRLAVSYIHNFHEAEDVCQTVFLKLLKQKNITPGKEKAWLEECAVHIEQSLNTSIAKKEQNHRRRQISGLIIIAAAAVLIVFLSCNTHVTRALAQTIQQAAEKIIPYYDPHGKHYDFQGGTFVIGQGTLPSTAVYNTERVPSWLKERNGELYFSANLENILLNDIISEETPFTYIYTDLSGIEHYIIVGGGCGTGDSLLDKVGWGEWYFDTALATEEDTLAGWVGGYSKNYLVKGTDEKHEWYQKGIEQLDIPWG